MPKKEKNKEFSEKYLEVLKKFNLTQDFKLTDYEKDLAKKLDKVGTMTVFDVADEYDLRPSEAKSLIDGLLYKGAIAIDIGNITLTEAAKKYIHTTKADRKAEKKFRNFLNCLNEEDLDKFSELVNSFKVNDAVEVPVTEVKDK